jgi:hypothetical protein
MKHLKGIQRRSFFPDLFVFIRFHFSFWYTYSPIRYQCLAQLGNLNAESITLRYEVNQNRRIEANRIFAVCLGTSVLK